MWVSACGALTGLFVRGPSFGAFFFHTSGSCENSLLLSGLKGAEFMGVEYRNKDKLLLSPSGF